MCCLVTYGFSARDISTNLELNAARSLLLNFATSPKGPFSGTLETRIRIFPLQHQIETTDDVKQGNQNE